MPRPASKKAKPFPAVWMRVTRIGMPLLRTAAWRKSAVDWVHGCPNVAKFALTLVPPAKSRKRP